MLTYYCPSCWKIVNKEDNTCAHCGTGLNEFNDLSFEQKLISSLHHSVPERRMMAAQILGNIHSQKALQEFQEIIENGESNYYILRTILIATAKLDQPERLIILQAATQHTSNLISELAKSLILMIEEGKDIEAWDQHTG